MRTLMLARSFLWRNNMSATCTAQLKRNTIDKLDNVDYSSIVSTIKS